MGHNAFGPLLAGGESPSWLVRLLYAGGSFQLGSDGWSVVVLYVLIPWMGVMAAGYGFGAVMQMAPRVRGGAHVSR